MLLKVTSEQVSAFWHLVEPTLERALPPYVDKELLRSNSLKMVLSGELQGWLYYDEPPKAFLATQILEEKITEERNLLIYILCTFAQVSRAEWEEMYKTLREYAKGLGCRFIVGYTNVPAMEKLTNLLGGDAETRFARLEV